MASNGIKIEIVGIEEANKKLKNISADKLKKVEEAIKKSGFYIQGEVVESVAGHRAEPRSVDTGRFMGSIKTTFPAPYTASIETNVEYAKTLEYGTSKRQPRHHFTNTVAREGTKVKEFVQKAIK